LSLVIETWANKGRNRKTKPVSSRDIFLMGLFLSIINFCSSRSLQQRKQAVDPGITRMRWVARKVIGKVSVIQHFPEVTKVLL